MEDILNKMKISKKANNKFLQLGFTYIIIAVAMFIALGYLGKSAKELMGLGRFFALILLIFGLAKIHKFHQFKQEKEETFEIKDKKVIFNNQEYLLENGYLSVEFKEEDEFYKVSLWLEKDKNTIQIFEDIVFNKDEMHSFLKLIKPYRKTDICLLENKENLEINEEKTIDNELKKDELQENQKLENGDLITLFNKGLMVEKREILYSEIANFLANITVINEKRYVDIDIVLKNKTEIKERLNSYDDQAKALYAKRFFELKGDISKDDYPCYKYNFWVAFVILILIAAGFSGKFGFIAVIAALFLAVIYFASLIDFFYHKDICKKVQKIIEERKAYDKIY